MKIHHLAFLVLAFLGAGPVSARPHQLPDPATNYSAYEGYTDGQFRCDDRPYTPGCGNVEAMPSAEPSNAYWADVCLERDHPRACMAAERKRLRLVRFFMQNGYPLRDADEVSHLTGEELRMERLAARVCGRDGTVDMDPVPGHPKGYPHCNRHGWNGHAYVCGDKYQRHILSDRLGRTRRDDPVVREIMRRDGLSMKEARIKRATYVIENGC